MPNNYFQFKQFTINQQHCAMKVGTDGVLLGAWANVEKAENILDIGTGTGLITLMLAQRSNAIIKAIEIEKDAFLQAKENIENSNWKDRISIENISLQKFAKTENQKFDLIVCNPPFFENNSQIESLQRTIARQTHTLSFEELIINSGKVLNELGKICLILPYSEFENIKKIAFNNNLFLNKTLKIKPLETKDFKRILLEFGFQKKVYSEKILVIEKGKRHCYTDDYIELTKDFYLKF
jgi:tRNA1Val (adenine37-N6)-methyltransferase